MAATESESLQTILDWFAERGFSLRFSHDRDEDDIEFHWADLSRRSSDEVVAPMFGRGATVLAAAQRAQQRFEVEQ